MANARILGILLMLGAVLARGAGADPRLTAKANHPSDAQRDVLVRVIASRETLLVGEPFSITLRVAIRRLPAPFSEATPFPADDPPMLSIPFFESEAVHGLAGPDVRDLLQSLLTSSRRRPGFGINELTVDRGPFDSFFAFGPSFGKRVASFAFPSHPETLDGIDTMVYELTLDYVPREEGTYTFGPVTFRGAIYENVTPSGRADRRPVVAEGDAATVKVVPPPLDNRPAGYSGAVGTSLAVDAELDTQTCRVGDPLTLTLTLGGDISLDNLRAPELAETGIAASDFRFSETTPRAQTVDGSRRYAYTLRPLRAGTLEIPPIPLSYYDPGSQTYRTVRTQPIPLLVHPAHELDEDLILAATNRTTGVSASPRRLSPAAFTRAPAGAHPSPSLPRPWQWVILIGMPMLLGATACGRVWVRAWSARTPTRRRAARQHEGQRLLRRAETLAARGPAEARALLIAGIRRQIGAATATAEASLTPGDIARLASAAGLPPEDAASLEAIVDRHTSAAYASGMVPSGDIAADATTARRLLGRLLTVLLLLTPLSSRASTSVADTRQFMWQEALTLSAGAATSADFVDAAKAYRNLLADGVGNGPLLFNLGTALLMAEQYDTARVALEAAEIYQGSTPAIRRNLTLALARGDPAAAAVLPWYRLPFFWHYNPPLGTRIAMAVLAFGCGCLIGILRMVGFARGWRTLLAVALIGAALFGSSTLASWHALGKARDRLLAAQFGPESGSAVLDRNLLSGMPPEEKTPPVQAND